MAASRKGRRKSLKNRFFCIFGGCFGISNKVSAGQGDGKSVTTNSGRRLPVKHHKIPMVKSTKEILLIKNEEKETEILAPPEDDELTHNVSRKEEKNREKLNPSLTDQIKWVDALENSGNPHSPCQRGEKSTIDEKGKTGREIKVAGEIDPIVGAIILTVTLMVMLIWGKMCAVLSTAAWFYFLPRFTTTTDSHRPIKLKTGDDHVDLDSWEYKKNVVLRGLLHRN